MKLSADIVNLATELKRRYAQLVAVGDPALIGAADEAIAGLYALSCGSVVVGLNAVGGKGWRKVMIDKAGIKALAAGRSSGGMLDAMMFNLQQFDAVTATIAHARTKAMMNRYLAEWHHVVDAANVKLHRLAKARASPLPPTRAD